MALGQELFLGRLGVDEDDVGIAAPREIQRLARAERDDAHLDAGLPLEDRQQNAEQPGLFGRRRRRDGNVSVLRLRDASGQDEQDNEENAAEHHHGSSPSRKLAASGEAGCFRKRSAGARSTSRP